MRGFPVSHGDSLQVSSWNALAGVGVTIRGYTRTPDGGLNPFSGGHTPNTDRTINSTSVGLPEGEILNVSAFVSAAAPIIGQTFVRLQLVRGGGGAGIVLATLAADYVTAVQPVAWPGSPIKRSVDGPGAIRSITGTDPAAGVEITETVPTGARWQPIAIAAALVTNATAANRIVNLTFDDGTTIFARGHVREAHTASLAHSYAFGRYGYADSIIAFNRAVVGMPPAILLAGHRISTQTTNIQAGDNWGAPQLLVEEHLEGAA